MSAIDEMFARLRAENQRALMPFITAGDPSLEVMTDVLRRFEAMGCDMCEVGIPYSDPIADGPVIQASYTRSLENGFKLDQLFAHLPSVSKNKTMPMVAMVSYAIIFRKGLKQFVHDAKLAGFAGAIVPDCPGEQADELSLICRDQDFSLIQLVTPTTSIERAASIARQSSGFVYFVSVTGITGERESTPDQALAKIGLLRDHTDLPICLGFGISKPEHVHAIGARVDGFIVGSAIVRRVSEIAKSDRAQRQETVESVAKFVESMLSAVKSI